jgi:F-type H+-transporting ATPase subunit b
MFTPEALASYVSTALITVINLLVTYFVLKRFLFKPILKVLRSRREKIAGELAQSETRLRDAEVRLTQANDKLENANHEAAVILSEARSQAETSSETILTEARKEAAGHLTRADAEVNRMRITMLNEVRNEVADLSVAIASKVIGQVMDEHRQRELVDQFLDEQMQPSGQPGTTAGGVSDHG